MACTFARQAKAWIDDGTAWRNRFASNSIKYRDKRCLYSCRNDFAHNAKTFEGGGPSRPDGERMCQAAVHGGSRKLSPGLAAASPRARPNTPAPQASALLRPASTPWPPVMWSRSEGSGPWLFPMPGKRQIAHAPKGKDEGDCPRGEKPVILRHTEHEGGGPADR